MILKQDVESAVEKLSIAEVFTEVSKVGKTIEIIIEYISKASLLLMKDGVIRGLKWYNLKTWYGLALISYDLIKKLIEIWK